MIHPPIENIIFNSYKTLTKTASDEENLYLRKMGISGYRKIVLDMIKKNQIPKLMYSFVQYRHCKTWWTSPWRPAELGGRQS